MLKYDILLVLDLIYLMKNGFVCCRVVINFDNDYCKNKSKKLNFVGKFFYWISIGRYFVRLY